MPEIINGPVLASSVTAAEFGSGTGGLLVVVLLGAVSIGLFVALSGSLKRMRANVDSGRFGDDSRSGDAAGDGDRDGGDRDDGDRNDGDRNDEQSKSALKVPGQGHSPDGG